MKLAVVLCLVFTVVNLEAGTIHLEGAQKEKANQNAMECIKETGVKPEIVAEFKKGHLNDDESFKKFVHCFFRKAEVITSDGKLNIDVALAKLPPGIDKAAATKLLEECKNKKGKDVNDTTFEIFKCYYAGTETHILP